MTQEEWNNYVDTGYVPHYFIKEIVEKIKSGDQLTIRHLQVYMSHGSIIEVYLSDKNYKNR